MKLKSLGRRRPAVLAAAAVTATAVAVAGVSSLVWAEDSGLNTDEYQAGQYIVQVAGTPVASYTGDVDGFSATAAEDGARLSTDGKNVDRYRDYLAELREEVLGQVPGADTVHQYDTVLNGFSVNLSAAEARAMSKADGVVRMWPNEILRLDTSTTPDFLGLTGDSGVWQNQFGGNENAGEGVVVGIVDSGFWPENPSFAPLSEPRPDQDIIDDKWSGTCDEGADENADNNVTCNNKVIGARYYNNGGAPTEGEANSPRDFGGHGSHTASTAAGNYGVDAGKFGTLSGMAPAARLAVYKVCWETSGGCASSDSVAAIEDAVNDGVDVLNYSISGSQTYVVDPVEIAFFNAAAAGVFVAASAGNSGPSASTVAHNSPWLTTVAASSHNRGYAASLTLGNGATYEGVGKDGAVDATSAVLAETLAADGVSAADARRCFLGSLDPAKVEGKIVACERGANALVEKSQEVADNGGVGVVLYNVSGGATDMAAVDHYVPTVHVNAADGAEIVTYLGAADATVTLNASEQIDVQAPQMASFSSAGPALAGNGDLLKPDITAPGVDVVAAVAPPGNGGADFASYQGTSMSSPHIAGLGALMKAIHPDWSPIAIRSAMMTTATQTDNRGEQIQRAGEDANEFDYGSGHVVPSAMFDPGLVYDSGPDEWLQYGCSIGQFQLIGYEDLCDAYETIDPSDFNYPSIAIGSLAGSQTITRTVTNVSDTTDTYFLKVDAPEGVKVKVNKKSLTLKPGKSATFKVTFTRTDAAFGEYTSGSITWKDLSGHEVRSPIVLRPVPLATDAELNTNGTDGELDLTGVAGFEGTLNASVAGLTASTVDEVTLTDPTSEDFNTDAPAEGPHTKAFEVTVPEDAELARFATFQSDHGTYDDLDLFVYQKVDGELYYLGASASGGSDESATLPGGATYVVYVDLWGGASSLDVKFHSWIVGADEGNASVSPESQKVSVSKGFNATFAWEGLEAGSRYLGIVNYTDAKGAYLESTIINVRA
ncbi:S8 family peptidase [Stackebrandtia soli]|uniref:S8 family peptidase n=1 Tax=Stackebrandtia soli TaxID=1892856 RepID=UPI0039EC3C89